MSSLEILISEPKFTCTQVKLYNLLALSYNEC